jgi:hypothetical protein
MVQIIEEQPSFAQELGRGAGKTLGNFAGGLGMGALEARERKLENAALAKRGIDVSGLTGRAREIAIEEGMKRAALLGQGQRTFQEEGELGATPTQGSLSNQVLTGNQADRAQRTSPRQAESTITQQRAAVAQQGDAPTTQTRTSKSIIPADEIESEARRRGKIKISQGIPTDLQTEMQLIDQENDRNIKYRQVQDKYGADAENALRTVFPKANPVQLSNFAKRGEQYARAGLSEGEVKKQAALDARQYRDELGTLKDVQGARVRHKIGQAIKGTSRSDEARKQSIRLAAKPFLDRGEYDEVRGELRDKGYGPEEIEELISDLGEQTKKSLAEFVPPTLEKPKMFKYKYEKGKKVSLPPTQDPTYRTYINNPEGQQEFAKNLQNTLINDPNANLILLRKAYEDKGVDWDTFGNEYNNLLLSGQISQTEEQRKMADYLAEPPMNLLYGLWDEISPWGHGR